LTFITYFIYSNYSVTFTIFYKQEYLNIIILTISSETGANELDSECHSVEWLNYFSILLPLSNDNYANHTIKNTIKIYLKSVCSSQSIEIPNTQLL
jgi:hypothetical protein